MKKTFYILLLCSSISCTPKKINTSNLIGVWGLSGMGINEEKAKSQFAYMWLKSNPFSDIVTQNYKIIEIKNDSITFYHRKLGVENSNYKDNNSYVFDYKAKYEIINKNNKHFINIYFYSDTTTMLEIFELTEKKLAIEVEYTEGLGIEEFKKLK